MFWHLPLIVLSPLSVMIARLLRADRDRWVRALRQDVLVLQRQLGKRPQSRRLPQLAGQRGVPLGSGLDLTAAQPQLADRPASAAPQRQYGVLLRRTGQQGRTGEGGRAGGGTQCCRTRSPTTAGVPNRPQRLVLGPYGVADQPLRLRFELQDADLYSFQFCD